MTCQYHYCPNCGNSFQNPDPRIAELEQALKSFIAIAGEARREWDADKDSRVGKLLAAMSGELNGYRDDATAIHEAASRIAKTKL